MCFWVGGGSSGHRLHDSFKATINKVNRATATVEVDRHGAAPTYRMTLQVRMPGCPWPGLWALRTVRPWFTPAAQNVSAALLSKPITH